MRNKNENKGFTLVEIMIVIGIIGILSMTSIPFLFKYINIAKVSRVEADYNAIKKSVSEFLIENDKYPIWAINPYENELEDYIDNLSKKSPLGGDYYLLDSKDNNENVYVFNDNKELESKGILSDLGKLFLVIDFNDIDFDYKDKDKLNQLNKLQNDLSKVYFKFKYNSSKVDKVFLNI